MLFCLSIAVFFLPTFLSLSLCLSFTLSLDLGFNTCVLCATSLFLCVSVFFLSLFTLYRMIEKKIGWYCRQQCVETYGTYEMTYEIAESTILKIKKKWKERDTEIAKKKNLAKYMSRLKVLESYTMFLQVCIFVIYCPPLSVYVLHHAQTFHRRNNCKCDWRQVVQIWVGDSFFLHRNFNFENEIKSKKKTQKANVSANNI